MSSAHCKCMHALRSRCIASKESLQWLATTMQGHMFTVKAGNGTKTNIHLEVQEPFATPCIASDQLGPDTSPTPTTATNTLCQMRGAIRVEQKKLCCFLKMGSNWKAKARCSDWKQSDVAVQLLYSRTAAPVSVATPSPKQHGAQKYWHSKMPLQRDITDLISAEHLPFFCFLQGEQCQDLMYQVDGRLNVSDAVCRLQHALGYLDQPLAISFFIQP